MVDLQHGRGSHGSTRLVHRSDAVCAIAVTLLLVTVDVPVLHRAPAGASWNP